MVYFCLLSYKNGLIMSFINFGISPTFDQFILRLDFGIVILSNVSTTKMLFTGVIQKSLPVLSTEPVLQNVAVDRAIRLSTELYGCRQKNNFLKCASSVLFCVFFCIFGFKPFLK